MGTLDTSIRMMGKGTSTVQSLYSTLYKRLFHWTVFVTQEVHTALNVHPGSAQCFI